MNETIQTIPPYRIEIFDKVIQNLYTELAQQHIVNLHERLEWITEKFLGCIYLNGALGEGPQGQFDQNPVYRTEAFDCVTYVNTMLALALAKNFPEFRHKIIELGYNKVLDYKSRHHFMTIDWNIANADLGIIQDSTQTIAEEIGVATQMAETVIDKPNWFRFKKSNDIKLLNSITTQEGMILLEELQNLADQMEAVNDRLSYLPLAELFDEQGQSKINLASHFPRLTIVEIVCPNWNLVDSIGTHLNISHLGFVLNKGGALVFRHASTLHKKVIDEPFIKYVQQRINHSAIKGIHVLNIQS